MFLRNRRVVAERYKPSTYFYIANLQIKFYIKKFFYYNLDSIFASSNFKK